MTTSIINFKRGDTLSLLGTYKVGGVATSVVAMTIASQVRTQAGALVEALTVTKNAATGSFSVSADATDTSAWPAATLICDIQFSLNGVVQSTETFLIKVQEDVTQ